MGIGRSSVSCWWKAWKAATTLDRSTPTSTSGVGKNWQWTWFGSDCLFFRQGFDAPFKFWNRKNEVFLVKNDWSINVRFLLFLPNPHLTNNWYCIPIQETREWSKLKVYYNLYSLCWSINKGLIVPTMSQKNTESNTANAVSLLPGIMNDCTSIINPMKEHGLKMKNNHER